MTPSSDNPPSTESYREIEAILSQLHKATIMTESPFLEDLAPLLETAEKRQIEPIIQIIVDRLQQLEKRIHQSTDTLNSILPLIAELLYLKNSESRQAIIEAVVPVIDQIIQTKSDRDWEAMTTIFADLIPSAITKQIENSPQTIAKAIAPEMADAIREQIKLNRDSIAEALAPAIGQAIKVQITLERDAIVDALYPIIGNTIARYFADFVERINQKLENTFSPQGIQRKIKAKIQGVSETELLFKEGVSYVIREVFLIHKNSGLVMAEIKSNSIYQLDSQMVGGMLTAIRSFVNDCIAESGEVLELNEIEYGDSKIIFEVAGYCYLAVVVKGDPPLSLKEEMKNNLIKITNVADQLIQNYDGNQTLIPTKVQLLLNNLLLKKDEKKDRKKPPLFGLGIVLSLLLLFLGRVGFIEIQKNYWLNAVNHTLEYHPKLALYPLFVKIEKGELIIRGIVPNESFKGEITQKVNALKIPLKLNNQTTILHPNLGYSLEGEIKRLTNVINQMEKLAIKSNYQEGRVTLQGKVENYAQLHQIPLAFKAIPSVKEIDSDLYLQLPTPQIRFYFESGSSQIRTVDRSNIPSLITLLKQYPYAKLVIIGYLDRQEQIIDPTASLALQRAISVRSLLQSEGMSVDRLLVRPIPQSQGEYDSKQPLLYSRYVRFELFTED